MKMHTNRHQEAKLLALDTFLSRKNAQNCVCGRGTPLGELIALPHDPLAGNGEGLPGRGRERRGGEGRERVGRGGVVREGEGLSPRTKILATALVVVIVVIVVVVLVHAHTILHVTFKTSETKPTKIL